jgi:hypothetical protein
MSTGLWCSFCGAPEHQVDKIIAGPGVYICAACVDLCNSILADVRATPAAARTGSPPQFPDTAAMSDEELLERLPRCAKTGAEAEAEAAPAGSAGPAARHHLGADRLNMGDDQAIRVGTVLRRGVGIGVRRGVRKGVLIVRAIARPRLV